MKNASMRPGRLTPENHAETVDAALAYLGFNEAGAINPGKPRDEIDELVLTERASMRPGRLTPENPLQAVPERIAVVPLQ